MLAHCQKRFEGKIDKYKRREKSGGLGCFTPDSFPVFDVFRDNVFVIADSNHGYKMIGVGKLVAQEICGEKSQLARAVPFLAIRRRQACIPFPTARSRGADRDSAGED